MQCLQCQHANSATAMFCVEVFELVRVSGLRRRLPATVACCGVWLVHRRL